MGRKALRPSLQFEPYSQPDTRYPANIAAASAILLKIAARIDARQAAAHRGDVQASNGHLTTTPSTQDENR